MPPIRVLYSSNQHDLSERIDALRAQAEAGRAEPGCLEFEIFRGVEFPENFVQLELWESPAAFDAHWQRSGTAGVFCDLGSLGAPHHDGTPDGPRRDGCNAAEFYPYMQFARTGRVFEPKDPALRTGAVRWPTRSGVRIVIQQSTDPANDAAFGPYVADTRAQAGCREFEFFRSLSVPEHSLHLELWDGPPEVYDRHYYLRTIDAIYGGGLPRPPSTARPRRYGTDGFEFYQTCFFTLAGTVWQPEDPSERVASVAWG